MQKCSVHGDLPADQLHQRASYPANAQGLVCRNEKSPRRMLRPSRQHGRSTLMPRNTPCNASEAELGCDLRTDGNRPVFGTGAVPCLSLVTGPVVNFSRFPLGPRLKDDLLSVSRQEGHLLRVHEEERVAQGITNAAPNVLLYAGFREKSVSSYLLISTSKRGKGNTPETTFRGITRRNSCTTRSRSHKPFRCFIFYGFEAPPVDRPTGRQTDEQRV